MESKTQFYCARCNKMLKRPVKADLFTIVLCESCFDYECLENEKTKFTDVTGRNLNELKWIQIKQCPECKSENLKWYLSATKTCNDCGAFFRSDELIKNIPVT